MGGGFGGERKRRGEGGVLRTHEYQEEGEAGIEGWCLQPCWIAGLAHLGCCFCWVCDVGSVGVEGGVERSAEGEPEGA